MLNKPQCTFTFYVDIRNTRTLSFTNLLLSLFGHFFLYQRKPLSDNYYKKEGL